MAKKETVFRAGDGKKCKTEAEADRHDEILRAKDEYQTARRHLGLVLLKNERTADGRQICVGNRTLYCVVNSHHAPQIQECKFFWNAWDWGIDDNDCLQLSFRLGCGDRERWVVVGLDDLYADADNARQAVIEAKQVLLHEKQDELAALKADPSQIPVNY